MNVVPINREIVVQWDSRGFLINEAVSKGGKHSGAKATGCEVAERENLLGLKAKKIEIFFFQLI